MKSKSPATFQLFMLHPKYWGIWLGYGFLWLLVQLLPFCALIVLGKLLGFALGKLLKNRRKIAEINLKLCMPEMSEQERKDLIDRNMKEIGVSLFETGMAWFWPQWRIKRVTAEIEGTEYMDQAKAKDKGILMISCHMMNLEMGGRMFGEIWPANCMYRPNKNPVLEFFQYRGRSRSQLVALDKNNLRLSFKALKNKEILWYAPDQDLGRRRSIFVPFFKVEDTATAPGASSMARLGNAVVMPFYQFRKPDNSGYKIVIFPPFENFPSGDELIDTTRVNLAIEQMIRQHPEQYLWVHRRFKTRANPQDPYRYS